MSSVLRRSDDMCLEHRFDGILTQTHFVCIARARNLCIAWSMPLRRIIKRNFRYLSQECFVMLYKALVRSPLDYANAVWNPYKR